jgi:hypothetical protein
MFTRVFRLFLMIIIVCGSHYVLFDYYLHMCAYIKHFLEWPQLGTKLISCRAKTGRVGTTRVHSHGGCPPCTLGSSVRARVRYENRGYLSMVSLRSTNKYLATYMKSYGGFFHIQSGLRYKL